MGRARLEKPKLIVPYSIREELSRKKTHWKTKNEMEKCDEEECVRPRKRNNGKAQTTDRYR